MAGTAADGWAGHRQDRSLGARAAPGQRPGRARAGGPGQPGRSGAEAELGFAGLYDLLAGVDLGGISGLAVPQRRALEAALLRAEPTDEAPERFAIAAGFLTVLRTLAVSGPLLLAVDDLQWLDA